MTFSGKTIMITGGTGSFGQEMVRHLMSGSDGVPDKIIIYSRDEFKQVQMISHYGAFPNPILRFFIGDVRDKARLYAAMKGVDYVFHAAALKQVPLCEYNTFECVKTNILGAQNVIETAISRGVKRVVALSSDKAVAPINLYGATKLVAEKMFTSSNVLGGRRTSFSAIRYGNVLASRGSVLQEFIEQAKSGEIFITDKRMTRFWWTLPQSVDFAITALELMVGGEVFVPKIESASVRDLASAVCPHCRVKEIGIRPGEKLHEFLVAPDESSRTYDCGWAYMVAPDNEFFEFKPKTFGNPVPDNWHYCSENIARDDNVEWLKEMIENIFQET